MNITDEHKLILRESYNSADSRTWPYFPIIMPLKNGLGPADENDCDEITWEVWDVICETYGSYNNLPDAINRAINLCNEFMSNDSSYVDNSENDPNTQTT